MPSCGVLLISFVNEVIYVCVHLVFVPLIRYINNRVIF